MINRYQEYQDALDRNPGPNMKNYLRNRVYRDEAFNACGFIDIYGAAVSIGYNLGVLIEDVGRWVTDNPDFSIRLNPYTNDFTPIEKTLQEADELGLYIYP